jgi:hypothetical protein
MIRARLPEVKDRLSEHLGVAETEEVVIRRPRLVFPLGAYAKKGGADHGI